MDDRIIDFNDLKNKAREKDVDKLEDYMYSLYYEMAEGKLTMSEFSKEMFDYMEKNNISQDKFMNMQKKLMSRYGLDMGDIESQLKSAGINIDKVSDMEQIRKTVSFEEKYKGTLKAKVANFYNIKNDRNDIEMFLEKENVIIQSEGKIDLNDIELSEFLCSYKKLQGNNKLKINLCEYIKRYDY